MDPRTDSLESAIFRGHRLVRRQVAAMRKTVEMPPNGGRRFRPDVACRKREGYARMPSDARTMESAGFHLMPARDSRTDPGASCRYDLA